MAVKTEHVTRIINILKRIAELGFGIMRAIGAQNMPVARQGITILQVNAKELEQAFEELEKGYDTR
jgi:hypothetical protein